MCLKHKFKLLPGCSNYELDVRTLEVATFLMIPLGYNPESKSVGFGKITKTAQIAKEMGYQYFWIDTCCIDKSSSAELQEAINSMYLWYQRSALCLVYLEDAESVEEEDRDRQYFAKTLEASRWLTRGWTLQELIAPRRVKFFDRDWNFIMSKHEPSGLVSQATGIPEYVLDTGDHTRSSVAQKMSWAAKRTTTRLEDTAYSLLGLFDVHLAMLYGEGSNAFLRLQEEIMKKTPDDSIFAWNAEYSSLATYRGLLARSPSEFKDSGVIRQGEASFTSVSNQGLSLTVLLASYRIGRDEEFYAARLRARWSLRRFLLILRKIENDQYVRVMVPPNFARDRTHWSAIGHLDYTPSLVHVRQTPIIPKYFCTEFLHCFHLRRSHDDSHLLRRYKISKVWPPKNWASDHMDLAIPQHVLQFTGIVWIERISEQSNPPLPSCQVLLGFDRTYSEYWCEVVSKEDYAWPSFDDSEDKWVASINAHSPWDKRRQRTFISTMQDDMSGHEVIVSMATEIHRDRISIMVDVDGLATGISA